MNQLWAPCINKKLNSDILINIFGYCDVEVINVCKLWKNVILESEYLWELWYKQKWTTQIYQGNWKNIYLKMNRLDNNWFNNICHQTTFYENTWVLHSKIIDNYIITSSKWGLIKLWKIDQLKNMYPQVYSGHLGPVSCIDFDVKNKVIISGSHDGTIRIWDFDDNYYKKMLTHHHSEVYFLKYHDNKIYSCSKDNTLKIYNLTNNNIESLIGHLNSVWSFDFDKDYNIYSCSLDGTIKFWKKTENSYSCQDTLKICDHSVLKVCYKDEYLFVGTWDGTLSVYYKHQKIYTIKLHLSFISSMDIINDKLITAGFDNQIKIFKVIFYPEFKLILRNIITSDKITSISTNNTSLLTTNTQGKINFYNFDRI